MIRCDKTSPYSYKVFRTTHRCTNLPTNSYHDTVIANGRSRRCLGWLDHPLEKCGSLFCSAVGVPVLCLRCSVYNNAICIRMISCALALGSLFRDYSITSLPPPEISRGETHKPSDTNPRTTVRIECSLPVRGLPYFDVWKSVVDLHPSHVSLSHAHPSGGG